MKRVDESRPPTFAPGLDVQYGNGVPRICYHASEELYHRLGGKDAGLTPMHIYHEGLSHWYLRWEVNGLTLYLDPTAGQFDTPVPYAEGTGRGFQTKERCSWTRNLFDSKVNVL